MTLHLTGFGPFPGVPDNPTGALVGRLADVASSREVLPVSFARAAERVVVAVAARKPTHLLLLGVAAGGAHIRLERQAVNTMTADNPDVDGVACAGQPLDLSLPASTLRRTTLDIDALAATLQAAGHDARPSSDAGQYVCNGTYFHALGCHPQALFVHVPMPDPGGLDLDGLEAALRCLIGAL
jgi:pyroglutamyl-peptidase